MKMIYTIFGIIQFIWIMLKFMGIINYEWQWVLLPLWAPFLLSLLIMITNGLYGVLEEIITEKD